MRRLTPVFTAKGKDKQMTPNKQKLIERLLKGNDDLFTAFVIAGLEENLEIISNEVKKILSMDRILGHRIADLIDLRADGEATIRILKYYGAGDYPVAAELMAKAVGIQEWECSLEDDAQPIPALKDAQERTKGLLTEADHNEPALTLDIDDYGIWLIEEAPHGEKIVTTKQLGHVSWKQVALYVQKPLAELKGQDRTMTNNHWHYQLMYHKVDMKSFVDGGYYAIHEYYPSEDGDGWTEEPITVDGESVEEVKQVLQMMLEDIERHGVKDYE